MEDMTVNRRDFLKTTGKVGMAVMLGVAGFKCTGDSGPGQVALPSLPYPLDALAPHLSAKALELHHGKHHIGYVNKVNELVAGTPYARMALEKMVVEASGKPEHADIFNNAAQVYNHALFWNSLSPEGGGDPTGELKTRIDQAFGSAEKFRGAFQKEAGSLFGSGWVWLVQDGERLEILSTRNADTPFAAGKRPLLVVDLWEHAYYVDYQNRRADYVQTVLDHLINWEFAAGRLTAKTV